MTSRLENNQKLSKEKSTRAKVSFGRFGRCENNVTLLYDILRVGLGDDFDDDEEMATEELLEEQPIVADSKPFNVKKFRDNLRKSDCIMGESTNSSHILDCR